MNKTVDRSPYISRLQTQGRLHLPRSKTMLKPLPVPSHVRMHQSTRCGVLAKQYLDLVRDTAFKRNNQYSSDLDGTRTRLESERTGGPQSLGYT